MDVPGRFKYEYTLFLLNLGTVCNPALSLVLSCPQPTPVLINE